MWAVGVALVAHACFVGFAAVAGPPPSAPATLFLDAADAHRLVLDAPNMSFTGTLGVPSYRTRTFWRK